MACKQNNTCNKEENLDESQIELLKEYLKSMSMIGFKITKNA